MTSEGFENLAFAWVRAHHATKQAEKALEEARQVHALAVGTQTSVRDVLIDCLFDILGEELYRALIREESPKQFIYMNAHKYPVLYGFLYKNEQKLTQLGENVCLYFEARNAKKEY